MVRPNFEPVKPEKISTKIAQQIKSLITTGELKPGDVLPPERELVKVLKVSRASLREALKSLTGMGFLEVTQTHRTIVKS
ncbi:MAG: FadR family transcriptional regulator, partial [Deltaproteobacteria bacterium]|nr:FadR family transcriptional regulator [Deltaproteobacteria bacterium]